MAVTISTTPLNPPPDGGVALGGGSDTGAPKNTRLKTINAIADKMINPTPIRINRRPRRRRLLTSRGSPDRVPAMQQG
jgi:hypothetical protein